jgi:membrane protease YdiL (CAAX protease family)
MRKFAILEPLLMFGLIVAYIWRVRLVHPRFWIAIPALMFASHLVRRESPRALGFTFDDLRKGLGELVPRLLLIALPLLAVGGMLHTVRLTGLVGALLEAAAYLPWGLVQQYALNGYFLNRLDAAVPPRLASRLAALLFCIAHAPNPFLMAISFPLGWYATLLYRRTHNLYLLGMAHAAIGSLVFFVVPDSVTHHMRVGPGWFQPWPGSGR